MRRIDSKGFKEFHQKRLDEKKFFAEKKLQEEKKILKEQKRRQEIKKVSEELRYNWRDDIDLQESNWSPTTGSGPTNSIAQRFAYSLSNLETGQPNTVTVSGLGGVESIPSTVSVDFGFGETEVVSAPTFSQLGLQGYAKPLGTDVRRRRDYEDVNPRLDASQEFARAVGADYMMNARVQSAAGTLQNSLKDDGYLKDTGWKKYFDDFEAFDRLTLSQQDAVIKAYERSIKAAEIEQLRDYERSLKYDPSKTPFGADYGEVSQVIDGEKLLPQELQDILNRRRGKSPALGGTVTGDEKKKIRAFLMSKDGVDLMIKDLPTYDRLLNSLTGRIPTRNLYPGKTPQPKDHFGDFDKPPHVRGGGSYIPGGGMIDPSAYADAMKSVVNAINPSLSYKAEIAQSVLSNEPIEIPQSEIPKSHIKGLVNGIENDSGLMSQLMQTYTNTPTPYSDENIYELPNGEVRAHTPETRKLYPDNTRPVGDGTRSNPIAGAGQAQMELVDPKDGQPYIKYRDHAYHNLKSKDTGELPDVLSNLASGAIHSLAGKNNPETPNTGAMSNYPSNIKGDVYKTIIIPYSEFSPKLRRAVNDKIGVEQQRAAGINVGSPEVNTGTGRDGTFGRGTYGQGRPSDPKSSYTFDKETGEPQYTGWSEAEYTDKVNEINRKYSDILAPYFKNMTGKFGTGFGSASDAERTRAYEKAAELEPVHTAELDKLYNEYQRQTSEFQKAQEDWFAQQNAESEARAKAIDEIDNEEDPYSDLIADLGELLEKLRREGKLIKRWEIVGPGEEGYVDTTNMANAIGYNRRPIYTARAEELMKQLGAAQDAQVAWMNAQQKRREAAEKADYSDAGGGGKPKGDKGDGGKPKGDGGKPKGGGSQPIPMYGGGAMMGTPPSLASFLGSLSSGARKKGMRESTWDRINKYR